MARRTAGTLACLVLAAALVTCGDDAGRAIAPVVRAEPTAGAWRTWVLAAGNEIGVPIPPARESDKAKADIRAVQLAAAKRTASTRTTVDRWSGPLPTKPWTETAFDLLSKAPADPPLATRNLALLHVAMADAVVSAYQWKYEYEVKAPEGVTTLVPASPDPSYPSEHAAIAGAASKVLAYLFPGEAASRFDELAAEAAQSRIDAGTNTPSDVDAGLALGRAVADKVIAYAKADGAGAAWNGRRPAGITDTKAFWQPAPGVTSAPLDPEAGRWKGWVLTDNAAFRPGPPPAYSSAELKAAAQDAVDTKKSLTEDQKRVARFWEGGDGTRTPGGLTLLLALPDLEKAAGEGGTASRWTLPQATRALAMLTTALADAGIAVWDAKYTYWYPRPENVVRDLAVDRSYSPFLPTPRSPAYPSDSAGYAGAAVTVMTSLFPKRANELKARADEQTAARVYAGAQWSFDAVGQDAGRRIAQVVIARMKSDTVGGKA
jgi:membrane-associated phospholipid phosphatase